MPQHVQRQLERDSTARYGLSNLAEEGLLGNPFGHSYASSSHQEHRTGDLQFRNSGPSIRDRSERSNPPSQETFAPYMSISGPAPPIPSPYDVRSHEVHPSTTAKRPRRPKLTEAERKEIEKAKEGAKRKKSKRTGTSLKGWRKELSRER